MINTDQSMNLNEQPTQQPAYDKQHVTYITALSIINQLSGVLLFALVPAVLWVYNLSLKSVYNFAYARYLVFNTLTGKGVLLIMAIAFLCHTVIGIRYTLMDLKIGKTFGYDRLSALIGAGIAALIYFFI